jgi:hypothetical protein
MIEFLNSKTYLYNPESGNEILIEIPYTPPESNTFFTLHISRQMVYNLSLHFLRRQLLEN